MEELKTIMRKLYDHFPFCGNIVFVDVETTGLQRDARLIEIGAIGTKFNGNDLTLETFECLINPGFEVEQRITDITGITNAELEERGRNDDAYIEFAEWVRSVGPMDIVAHNAKFDRGKLEYNLSRVGINPDLLFPHFSCTMQMAMKKIKNVSNNKLGTIGEYFNFQNKSAHRALADTEVCAYIYAKMMLEMS